MTGLRTPREIALAASVALGLTALGWWWVTYRNVIALDYMAAEQAAFCIVADSVTCRLARSLCRSDHPLAIADYNNLSLWGAVALASFGLFLTPRGRA